MKTKQFLTAQRGWFTTGKTPSLNPSGVKCGLLVPHFMMNKAIKPIPR